MNILYINHYAGSIYHGMEYRPYYLAREWVKLGHNVTIVASNYSHIRSKNIDISRDQDFLYEMIDGIQYIWCKTPPYPTNGIKRVINIFKFLYQVKKLIPELIRNSTPDLVIASSTYPFDTKIAAKIAKKAGAKFVYEVHDLWPLTPIELGGMSRYHPFIYLMQKAEDFGYRAADKVVSLLPKACEYMELHGMQPEKFVYIPNGVSISDWQHNRQLLSDDYIRQIQKIKATFSFLIGYAGGMGESNALDYLIAAMAKVGNSHIACVLVGDGACKTQLKEKARQLGLNNVFFLDSISKTQVPEFLGLMDALYIGWNKLSIYRFGICPNKIFDYMLSQKPIIHSVTAGNDMVRDANCGLSVPAEDIEAIATAITEMTKKTKAELQVLGDHGYEYVTRNHDYQVLALKFLINCKG